jgi:serine/threonine protein kinase
MVAPVQEGDVLVGKFQVEKVLGVGGMGVVVAARHLQLDERVALKFLLPESLANADAVVRFAREARAAAKIKSEHVARVSDVGTLDNGSPFMVMEYLQGRDLGAMLASGRRFSVGEAVEYVLQACEAIAEAHALGIVHRDLKPANLFLVHRPDGSACVKVLDFGISKLTALSGSDHSGSMTRTSTLLGSPYYMSPEQLASGKNVDSRSDIWSLGVILYELLASRVPFQGDNIAELCIRIVQASPLPLREVRMDVPPELEQVIWASLEKDRERRYPTVAHFAQALAPFALASSRISLERISRIGYGSMAVTSDLEAQSPPLLETRTVDHGWGRSGLKPVQSSRWKVTAAATLGLGGAVALAYFAVRISSVHESVPAGASAGAAQPEALAPSNRLVMQASAPVAAAHSSIAPDELASAVTLPVAASEQVPRSARPDSPAWRKGPSKTKTERSGPAPALVGAKSQELAPTAPPSKATTTPDLPARKSTPAPDLLDDRR